MSRTVMPVLPDCPSLPRRRDLGLNAVTWLFDNPKDVVPSLPAGTWAQVNATQVFTPVPSTRSECPFFPRASGAKKKARSRVFELSWIEDILQNEGDTAAWEHSMNRYVYTLSKTCARQADPLWGYVWPSRAAPVKP
jgi:hypothetical protein